MPLRPPMGFLCQEVGQGFGAGWGRVAAPTGSVQNLKIELIAVPRRCCTGVCGCQFAETSVHTGPLRLQDIHATGWGRRACAVASPSQVPAPPHSHSFVWCRHGR